MTAQEIVQSARFIVDKTGQPTEVVIKFSAWQTFIELLENLEDRIIIQQRMKNWENKSSWTSWEDFETELDAMASNEVAA